MASDPGLGRKIESNCRRASDADDTSLWKVCEVSFVMTRRPMPSDDGGFVKRLQCFPRSTRTEASGRRIRSATGTCALGFPAAAEAR